jgi:hypothetical protein
MTDQPDAVAPDPVVNTEPETVQRPDADHGRPVNDGPAPVHPNADTSHTAVQSSRRTHEF